MPKQPLRDMVIVLPGITGSVLQKDGRDLWAPSGQAIFGAVTSLGSSFDALRVAHDDPDADDLGDGIRATRLVSDVHLVPGLVKIDGYTETLRMIQDTFDVVQGSLDDDRPANLFAFPYDWRRDNRVSARRLQRFVDRRLPAWRAHSGSADAKLILIGHSMGGLVSRYYLEVLEGWRNCRALITFGTPYRGSLNALDYLANGYKQLFVDLTETMRSMTSVYQLLPIYKSVQVGGAFQRVAEAAGLPGIDQARAAQALAFHREIEAAVTEHRKRAEYLEQGYTILPIVGTRQPTLQSARFVGGRVTVGTDLPAGIDPHLGDGDGTVPMLSAIPIELSQAYQDTFVPERHGSLQRNAEVLADLQGRLQRMQVVGLEAIRDLGDTPGPQPSRQAAERPAISVSLDDLYTAGEPVTLRASVVNDAGAAHELTARIEAVAGQTAPVTQPLQRRGETWELNLAGLPAGTYRVEVRAAREALRGPTPVHDVFEVVGTQAMR